MKDFTEIIMATDGSVIALKGLLNFVLTTTDGTILLFCYGTLAVHDPLSFRFEACVFLATICIIFLIAEYYNESIKDFIAITGKIHLYTDNRSMIKKFTTMSKSPTAHLKCTMDSKWDILQALHQLMNQIKE